MQIYCRWPKAYALIALPDRLQPGFDLRAARLEKRRQRQFLAERFQGLVGGEAGPVGGDLEQDAVGLAEIQASEIEPVDLAAVADVELVEPLRPRMILRLVRGPERDVVHAARALPRFLQIRTLDDV